ncbi:hypothetical protein ABIC37_002712 [Priestia megaterium]|uniref:hypothetical protein n=1 Tax=Priestia megaterium TaxID=1404 RepID=UPI003392FF37
MNEFVWIARHTAVDFRAGLCFPRAAGSLRLAIQLTARSNYIHKTYVHDHHEKIRTSSILHQESNSFG